MTSIDVSFCAGVRGVNDSPAEMTPKSSQPKEEMTPLGNNDSP